MSCYDNDNNNNNNNNNKYNDSKKEMISYENHMKITTQKNHDKSDI